jgi:formylglycine-generating enzyme required for sulfatase activity
VDLSPPANPAQIGQVRINPRDGAEMVWIPAGEFLRGSKIEEIDVLIKTYPEHPRLDRSVEKKDEEERKNPNVKREKEKPLPSGGTANGEKDDPDHPKPPRIEFREKRKQPSEQDREEEERKEQEQEAHEREIERTREKIPPVLTAHPEHRREGFINETPQSKITLDGYWIYKNPVTVAQYRKFCTGTGRPMPAPPEWGWKDDHPVVDISWEDARAYSLWAGLQLPTESQWEKAARGTDGRQFPWGARWDGKQCANSVEPDVMNSTRPVGSFPPNSYGLNDMAGNVWQMCEDWYDKDYYKNAPSKNPTGPASGTLRVMRGGSWGHGYPLDFRCSYRSWNYPSNRYNDYGFRCASR